jgi:hypothetical protein
VAFLVSYYIIVPGSSDVFWYYVRIGDGDRLTDRDGAKASVGNKGPRIVIAISKKGLLTPSKEIFPE